MRYKGYYFDEETNLYYLQTRYYDSELGRFISPDSFEYLAPETLNGLNLYAYCLNNPVMNTDPAGTFVSAILGFIFGGLWGGISAVAQGRDFWEGAKEGAISGALSGLAVDMGIAASVLLPGGGGVVLGFGIATVGGFIAGYGGERIAQEMRGDERDIKTALQVGAITATTNALAFGVSFLAGIAVGESTANLFKMLLPKYTPLWSWLFQAVLGWTLPFLGTLPGF